MKPFFLDEYELQASMPLRALEKLEEGGVCVYDVQKCAPGKLKFYAKSKESEKIFAILRGSCYTVNKRGSAGLKRRLQRALSRPGAIAAVLLFCLLAAAANFFVLRVEVDGSVRYAVQAQEILREEGLSPFSLYSEQCAERARARLARLSGIAFVTLEKEGSVLRVTFQESEEVPVPEREKQLLAPAKGVLQELTVLRGEALAQVGDEVQAGQKLAVAAEGEAFAVARASILCEGVFTYSCTQPGKQAKARAVAKAVFLSGGTPVGAEVTFTGSGEKFVYTVRLRYLLRLGVNFGETE